MHVAGESMLVVFGNDSIRRWLNAWRSDCVPAMEQRCFLRVPIMLVQFAQKKSQLGYPGCETLRG